MKNSATPAEERLREVFSDWWGRHSKRLIELPDTHKVMQVRAELLDSFVIELQPLGILDRFALAGVVAAWWGEAQYDIKTLSLNDFEGVVESWLTTIESAFELDEEEIEYWDKQKIGIEKRKARDHRSVPTLIPDYLAELDEAEAEYAELNARYKAAIAKPSDDDEDSDEDQLSAAELKALKLRTAASRRKVGVLEGYFLTRLRAAFASLDQDSRRELVLDVLRSQLQSRLESDMTAARRLVESAFHSWVEKYAAPLRDLEAQREATAARLEEHLKGLGYA